VTWRAGAWGRLRYALIAAIPVLVLVVLVGWYLPAGPSVTSGGDRTGFDSGYVANYYSQWSMLHVDSPFVVKHVQVVVHGNGCHGVVRLVGPVQPGGFAAGVSDVGLPGESIIGRRLTESSDLDVVLTASSLGVCSTSEVRIAKRSWGRTRWTAAPFDFFVDVTHPTGQDARTTEASLPTL
jgi:hypothetical protein